MQFSVERIDLDCVARLALRLEADSSALDEALFSCYGTSVLEIGNIIIKDEIEVLIRIVEVIQFLDQCLSEGASEVPLRFQFETRMKTIVVDGEAHFLDRADLNREAGVSSLEELQKLRTDIERYVSDRVGSVSRWLADQILARKFNHA